MPLGQLRGNGILDPLDQRLIQAASTLFHQQEQKHSFVNVPIAPLPDAQALRHFGRETPLQHRVDVGAAKADAAGVEHAVGPSEEVDAACHRVDGGKVALRPHAAGEAREVGAAVLFARGRSRVVPQEAGHVGKGSRGHEVSGRAVGHGIAGFAVPYIVVVDGNGRPETWALAASDVDGRKGVLNGKAASLQRTTCVCKLI